VRLRELESSPPKWLVSSIGRPPGLHVGMGGLLAWRRAVLAVDDYRQEYGVESGDHALGPRPSEERAMRRYDLTERLVKRARAVRHVERGIER
jgi:hypothetical protein